MDEELLKCVRATLDGYIESKGADDVLVIYLVSGEKFDVHGTPGQDEGSIWFDFVDRNDNDVSVRLDQIAAIRSVESGGASAFVV